MLVIPEFDMKILSAISKSSLGVPENDLCRRYGDEVKTSVRFLLSCDLVQIHQHSIKPFLHPDSNASASYQEPPAGNILATPQGKLEAKRWKVKRILLRRERWKERILGFLSGFLSGALVLLVVDFIHQSAG